MGAGRDNGQPLSFWQLNKADRLKSHGFQYGGAAIQRIHWQDQHR